MKKRSKLLYALALTLCLSIFFASSALLAVQARGNVETGREASLKLTYGYAGKTFEGLDIRIHRVANMFGNVDFELVDAFNDLPVELRGIKSQGEWKEVASTLMGYVAADEIAPAAEKQTDSKGEVFFEGLTTGLYLVEGFKADTGDGYCLFESFMITLPGTDENEEWLYDVEALPKSSFAEYEEKEVDYKINKLWKDDGNEDKRPTVVEVDLYCDGKFAETIFLSSENDWSYSWKSGERAIWTAIEKNVAEGYTVTVEQNGTGFLLTNTYDVPPPPGTGDFSSVYLAVAVMSLAGAVLVLFGLTRKKSEVK